MGPLSHVPISDALIIFFLTLGPLKAIAPFAQLTQGTDPAFRRAVAWRATAIATLIVFAVALLGALVLENWRVSIAAIVITAQHHPFLPGISDDHATAGSRALAHPARRWSVSAIFGNCHLSLGHSCPGHCSRHRGHCRVHGDCCRQLDSKGHRFRVFAGDYGAEPGHPAKHRGDFKARVPFGATGIWLDHGRAPGGFGGAIYH